MIVCAVNRAFLKASVIAQRFRAQVQSTLPDGVAPVRAKKSADGKVGELFIYEPIGYDCWTGSGITAKDVQASLEEMKGVKALNIFINCEGGDVFEAKAIYSQLLRFSAKKTVHVDGIAASAATFIAMAGDKIVTSPVGTWMIHEVWSGAMGNASDMRAVADLLDMETGTIAQTYAKRTKRPVEEMRALMSDETWMNAEQALAGGFTDEIVETAAPAETDPAKAKAVTRVAAAAALTQQRINSVTTAELLAARADFHRRNHPGQPGNQRPASR